MNFLAETIEAQLHREVYVAQLESLLKSPGSKQALAQAAGISPQYLSYILKLDQDPDRAAIIRTSSPSVARRIVAALPAPSYVRNMLLEHMLLASERRIRARSAAKQAVSEYKPDELVARLEAMLEQATFVSSPKETSLQYHTTRNAAIEILNAIDPQRHPLPFIKLCLVIHDTQCVLNRPAEALWYARLAGYVAAGLDRSLFTSTLELVDDLAFDILRAEAIAYYNLKLYRCALAIQEKAIFAEAIKQKPAIWIPPLYYDMIKTISKLGRFSIAQVEYLADTVNDACDRRDDQFAPLFDLMNSEGLARAYIQHGNYKKAHRVLQPKIDQINGIPRAGPLHQVLFFKTLAQLHEVTGDLDGWQHFISKAHQISTKAGLEHQRQSIEVSTKKHAFGDSVDLIDFLSSIEQE